MFVQFMKLKGITYLHGLAVFKYVSIAATIWESGILAKMIKTSFCYISDYPIDSKGL